MIEIIYRCDPQAGDIDPPPQTAEAARTRLVEGNREFAELLDPHQPGTPRMRVIPFDLQDIGYAEEPGCAPRQQPFALVLGCSDARVPTELIFNQACNSLFVVRVAGNVLGSECLGSIDYALQHFSESLKLIVVLGHSACGAVTAAVDAFLKPANYLSIASSHHLRAIVDRLLVSVRTVADAMERTWGADVASREDYRASLIAASVALNAALAAATLRQEFRELDDLQVQVAYGVYDLINRRVGLADGRHHGQTSGLLDPPRSAEDFESLAMRLAESSLAAE